MKRDAYSIQSINGSNIIPSLDMGNIPDFNFKVDLLSQQTLSGYELAKNSALTGTLNFIETVKSNLGEEFLQSYLASYNFGDRQQRNLASEIFLEKVLGESYDSVPQPDIKNTTKIRNNAF